jgi:hypothetical protein
LRIILQSQTGEKSDVTFIDRSMSAMPSLSNLCVQSPDEARDGVDRPTVASRLGMFAMCMGLQSSRYANYGASDKEFILKVAVTYLNAQTP